MKSKYQRTKIQLPTQKQSDHVILLQFIYFRYSRRPMPDEDFQPFSVSRNLIPPLHDGNGGTSNKIENQGCGSGVKDSRNDEIWFMRVRNEEGYDLDRLTHPVKTNYGLVGQDKFRQSCLPHLILHKITNEGNQRGISMSSKHNLTASIPPCQTPCSCFLIQNKLSCWNGRRVTLRLAGCSAF